MWEEVKVNRRLRGGGRMNTCNHKLEMLQHRVSEGEVCIHRQSCIAQLIEMVTFVQ